MLSWDELKNVQTEWKFTRKMHMWKFINVLRDSLIMVYYILLKPVSGDMDVEFPSWVFYLLQSPEWKAWDVIFYVFVP